MLALSAQPAFAAVNVTLDGVPLAFEAAPVIENGRVMAPMRGILQPLGYTVQWNEAEQTVLAEKNGVSISLPIGRDTAVVNGSTVPLDAPARIIQERTFVPLRFLAEHSGAQVLWDGSTETVSIHSAIADDPTERMKESAVYIQTNKMQGSGIVLSADGLIATDFHVLENASTAQFVFHDGSIYQGNAVVVGLSPQEDIALVRIGRTGLTPAAPATDVRQGEAVYAVGSPGGKRNIVNSGIVQGFDRDVISATAEIGHGSSGGGLFNASGGLVGITSSFGEGQYFSIPIARVLAVPQNLSIPLSEMKTYDYTPDAPQNLRCELDENGYANVSWSPVYGAEYYTVYTSATADGEFRPLKNNTLGGEKWYWGFPQAFGITSRNGESIYVKVSAVVNGRETPQSETLKVS